MGRVRVRGGGEGGGGEGWQGRGGERDPYSQ